MQRRRLLKAAQEKFQVELVNLLEEERGRRRRA
jgi:hypothetical protein